MTETLKAISITAIFWSGIVCSIIWIFISWAIVNTEKDKRKNRSTRTL